MMKTERHFAIVVTLGACLLAVAACSKQPSEHTNAPAGGSNSNHSGGRMGGKVEFRMEPASGFDYYLLVLSWAPEYCASHPTHSGSVECDPDRHFGFIVHGMWPQNDDGSHPSDCGSGPVPQATVRSMMAIMPARGLVQHEWRAHGTCTGLTPEDYFADMQKAFSNVQVPAKYKAPSREFSASPAGIEQDFAKANNIASGDFRISCNTGEMVAVEACLTKDLQYRECPRNVRDCRASDVLVRPAP